MRVEINGLIQLLASQYELSSMEKSANTIIENAVWIYFCSSGIFSLPKYRAVPC